MLRIKLILLLISFFIVGESYSQLIINEGSNKNYSTIKDEDGDFEDWIEIYNSGTTAIDLFGYSLSDNNNPRKWIFPRQIIQPNEFVLVFCSGKNRFFTKPFTRVLSDSLFISQAGWNTHQFSTPFFWDGISNVLINVCSHSGAWTNNSIHRQTTTGFNSTTFAGGETDAASACLYTNGWTSVPQRPNIKLNTSVIGDGNLQNSHVDYPAPYGNWYWSAKHQLLFRADELRSAGLLPGNIQSLAFEVDVPDYASYDYIELSMANTAIQELNTRFIPAGGNYNHTNFKISSTGESIKLYNPSGTLISSMKVNCGPGYDVSIGLIPDASSIQKKIQIPTPASSNNQSSTADNYAAAPIFSAKSGLYTQPLSVSISEQNGHGATIHFTLDGRDPDLNSPVWNGNPISINQTTILRAKAYKLGFIPSAITSASYFFNIDHTTPIISLISDPKNLFGPTGLFDNPTLDLLKAASVDYFDASSTHPLLHSRRAGIILDGGLGSRGNPQRPFRIKWDDGVLGEGPVTGALLPDRPGRKKYSDVYLFNGGGNYMVLPFKDAAQCKMMGDGAYTYFAASRPVTVYVNGAYWGLYDMKEKFNTEMFELYDNATENTIEILGSTAQNGYRLRAIEGDVQNFYKSHNLFSQLNPLDDDFMLKADQFFDMKYYHDYIIGELWMNNVDWGFNYNNLKIYRSDATKLSWRYCLMDLEYGLLPNHSSIYGGNPEYNCNFDLLGRLINHQGADPGNPHLNIFWKGIRNDRFRHYFINRFADQMNTLYLPDRLLAIENSMYNQTLPEMPKHFARWGDSNNVPAHMNGYLQFHELFKSELACRPTNMRNHLQRNFNLPQQVNVHLDVYPADAGKVKISTITPDNYPWQGIYFDGIPIQLEAQAKPGYKFSHWSKNELIDDTLNRIFFDTLTVSTSYFNAHFTPAYQLAPFSLLVYPNPTNDKVTIQSYEELPDPSRVLLYDMLGRKTQVPFTRMGGKSYVLNVSSLNAGYYILHYFTKSGNIYHAKLIKQ
jgi:hypothetical protein